jgi:hypothetical protein
MNVAAVPFSVRLVRQCAPGLWTIIPRPLQHANRANALVPSPEGKQGRGSAVGVRADHAMPSTHQGARASMLWRAAKTLIEFFVLRVCLNRPISQPPLALGKELFSAEPPDRWITVAAAPQLEFCRPSRLQRRPNAAPSRRRRRTKNSISSSRQPIRCFK